MCHLMLAEGTDLTKKGRRKEMEDMQHPHVQLALETEVLLSQGQVMAMTLQQCRRRCQIISAITCIFCSLFKKCLFL